MQLQHVQRLLKRTYVYIHEIVRECHGQCTVHYGHGQCTRVSVLMRSCSSAYTGGGMARNQQHRLPGLQRPVKPRLVAFVAGLRALRSAMPLRSGLAPVMQGDAGQ